MKKIMQMYVNMHIHAMVFLYVCSTYVMYLLELPSFIYGTNKCTCPGIGAADECYNAIELYTLNMRYNALFKEMTTKAETPEH